MAGGHQGLRCLETRQRCLVPERVQRIGTFSEKTEFAALRNASAHINLPIKGGIEYPTVMDSREALVALNMVEHVGPVRVRQLLEHFGEAPAILSASRQQLLQVRGIGEDTAGAIANWEKTIDLAGELKRIGDFGCHILTQRTGNIRNCCGKFMTRRSCFTSRAG